MRKKTLIIMLTITHLLCVLLGFCVSTLNTTQNEKMEPTEETNTISIEEAAEAKESNPEVAEKHIEESIITEANLAPSEETIPEKPSESVPTYTTSPTIQPPVTQPTMPQPPVTEPPAKEPEDEFGGGRV